MDTSALAAEISRHFGPARLRRWLLKDVAGVHLNPEAVWVLTEVGLPRVQGISDNPDAEHRGLPSLRDVGIENAPALRVIGGGEFSLNCLEEGEINYAVVFERGSSKVRFANSGALEWALFLKLYDELLELSERGLGGGQLDQAVQAAQARMMNEDPRAFDNPENVWPLVIEQIYDYWGIRDAGAP